jgi:L-lactate utilization protein LutC
MLAPILTSENVQTVTLAKMSMEIRDKVRKSLIHANMQIVEPKGINISRTLSEVDAGITLSNFAIAETGTVAEICHQDVDRLTSALPRIHICLLQCDQILGALTESASLLRSAVKTYGKSAISLISGPSRTADVELKLVLGVHGPHQVHVVTYGEE